jgi:hypothetical protein
MSTNHTLKCEFIATVVWGIIKPVPFNFGYNNLGHGIVTVLMNAITMKIT